MTAYDRESKLSLDSAPEHLAESARGTQQETDVSASMLQQMSRASDLQEGLLELYRQGGRGYGQAMFALQRVLGNVGVEQLRQQLTKLAEAEAEAQEVEAQRLELEADAVRQDVQMKRGEGARPSNAEVLEAAAYGVSASGDAVPFAEEMGALLGVDFAETRAHMGPEATAACEEMGAEAYTYGEHVVFRDANPRKETVAHELTHVAQQRQGVQLTGGVGQEGDAYEQQAEQAERGVVASPRLEPATSRTLAVQAKKEAEPQEEPAAPSIGEGDLLEGSTEPLDCPQFLASPDDWVKLQAAFESGPDDGLQALVSLTPILKENARANITFSTATLEGKEAETTFGPEAKAWLLEEFSTFQQQHQGLANEQLVSQYVSHVKQLGIPESLQTVEVFVNIDRLGTANEKELADTISTLHHEMTHAHQLLHDFLRVFPAGVSLDVNWLGSAYPLEDYILENETEEISAMEIGAYSEQAKALEALGMPPRGDYSEAVGRLTMLHQHWTSASPEFRESADADGMFVDAYMTHLEHFLAGFLEAVRPISIALLGGFDAASLTARHLGQGGVAGATATRQAEGTKVQTMSEDRCAQPKEVKPEGMWAPDSDQTKQTLAHSKSIHKLGDSQDKYEWLKQLPGWVDADGAFRTILEQRHEYPLAGQAVAELKVALERANTGGSTTFDALSDEVQTRNQQADDPNIFVPTPVMFHEPGSHDVMKSYGDTPAAFARNALMCNDGWSVIKVSGYSDDLGDDAARESISRERAEVVKAILVNCGIPEDRVLVEGRGYEAPPGVVHGEIEKFREDLDRTQTARADPRRALEARRIPYRQASIVAVR